MTASLLHRAIRSPLPALAAILALTSSAWAGVTKISNQPLASLPNVTASPNLLLVMDTSGSMGWEHMPDDMNNYGAYGFFTSQCNGVAYDSATTYTPPVKYDGTSYGNVSFSNAPLDGYVGTSGGTLNLGSSSASYTIAYNNGTSGITNPYYHYYKYTGSQPVMGWTYTSSGVTQNTFYNECNSSIGSTPGSGVFTEVVMTSASTDAQNYANWFSYYRMRYLLMRTAMGRAMQSLAPNPAGSTPGYRVGFSTIYDVTAKDPSVAATVTDSNGATVTNTFVGVSGFDSTQMSKFYNSLYAVKPKNGTNLPDALSEAGRYFANKVSGQSADPMQYACQRNYTLMTTDGYWNSNSKDYALNGSTRVGNQDSGESKPLWDGTHVTKTTTTPWSAPATDTSVLTETSTITWTLTGTMTGTAKLTSGSHKGQYQTTTTTQTYTETITRVTSTPQTGTASYTETVVVTDGVQTSDTNGTVSYTWQNGTPTATTTNTGTPPSPVNTAWSGWGTTKTTNTYGSTAGTGSWTYSQSSGTQSNWTSVSTVASSLNIGTYVAGTSSSSSSSSGGSSDTLSDVAEYYYKTDLRSDALGNCQGAVSSNVCSDIVPTTSDDPEKFQHMNTFTIGLGVNGTLPHTSDTLAALTAGTTVWPVPSTSGDARNVDDLWHAALNGRGQYFSALNANQLSNAISSVVNSISAVKGAGSGSSTSSLALVQGDNNQIYTASYTTSDWTGELIAQTLNGDGTIKAQVWSAQTTLDSTDPTTGRKIYFNSGGTLKAFTYANLTAASLDGNFSGLCSKTVVASQCPTLSSTTADLTAANDGTNLVNYLRGVRTYETAGAALTSGTTKNALYRARKHVLGDIIDGAPVYVGKPPFGYADAGYADFVTNNSSRTPAIYTAGNDGMLHAFSASTSSGGGSELWAFVPTAVMPNLYKLADANYSVKHQFFVDGAPVEGDVYVNNTWKTILVGGFNSGGQGYYALDITDPANPALLWEFSDTNMGLSYGNPIITKNAAGTWVVVFTSGYNNTGGDGNGHLYVVDAATGTKLKDIATYTSGTTAAGSTTTPSGLAQINAWIDVATNNTALRFYGGDMLGNVWRFDTDARVAPNNAALLLATLQVGTTPQPITTRPEMVSISSRPAVVIATGRYLDTTDITDTTQQSLYVIADNLDATSWGNPRTNTAAFVKESVTNSTTTGTGTVAATNTALAINFGSTTFGGWYIDLPQSGERVFTNMGLSGTELTMSTAIPSGDACTSGGKSWIYYINLGSATGTTKLESDTSLIVGVGQITDASGNTQDIFNFSDGSVKIEAPPASPPSSSSTTTRTSWRELTN